MSIRVLAPGLLTSVQDAGRCGYAAIGVGTAGAMDSVALRLANSLVGNADDAAALELTLLGPRLLCATHSLIAITGAQIEVRCNDRPVPTWRPVWVRAGSTLAFGAMHRGARAYVAVAGGIDVTPRLGSRSTDVNAGLGPIARALGTGDELPTLPAPRERCAQLWRQSELDPELAFAGTTWSVDPAPWFDGDRERPLRAIPGTHFDRLDRDSQRALFGADFRIGIDSNRVGMRLEGAPLGLREATELISAGTMPGTIQLPPGGMPIVLTAEAPPTGGYPRIAQVIAVDQPRLAQRPPGDTVSFVQTDLADAQMRYLERERALRRLSDTLRWRLHDS
jgi:antagonist of KipI